MATGTGNLPNQNMVFTPFDILTAEEQNKLVENIEALADGSGIGDEAIGTIAIADGAVTGVKIAGGSYSTSEVNTGAKWIDGKDIYKKTIDVGALPNATNKTVAHGITGLDEIVKMDGSYTNGTIRFPLNYTADSGSLSHRTYINGSNISIVTGSDRIAFSGYITLLYTKT